MALTGYKVPVLLYALAPHAILMCGTTSSVVLGKPSMHVYVRVSKVFVVSQQHSPSRRGDVPSVVESGLPRGVLFGGIVVPAPAPHSVTLKVQWFLDVILVRI